MKLILDKKFDESKPQYEHKDRENLTVKPVWYLQIVITEIYKSLWEN